MKRFGSYEKNRSMRISLRVTEDDVAYIESFSEFNNEEGGTFTQAFSNMIFTFTKNDEIRQEALKLAKEVYSLDEKKARLLKEVGHLSDISRLQNEKSHLEQQVEELSNAAATLQETTRDAYRATDAKVKKARKSINTALEMTKGQQKLEGA